MPQGYELAAMQPNDDEDDDYSEESSDILGLIQAKLKRKKDKRILLGSICVIAIFLIVGGIACGVILGTTGGRGHQSKDKTIAAATGHSTANAVSSDVVSETSPTHLPAFSATAILSSSVPVVITSASQLITVTTTSTTKVVNPTLTSIFRPSSAVWSASSTTHRLHSVVTTTSAHTPSHSAQLVDYSTPSNPSSTTSSRVNSVMTITPSIQSFSATTSPRVQSRFVVLSTSSTPSISSFSATITSRVHSVMTTTSSIHSLPVTTSSRVHSMVSSVSSTPSTDLMTSSRVHPSTTTTSTTPSPSPKVVQPNIANSHVLSYINTRYDPCEDFYRYSCGHWYNPYPSASHWGTASELALSNYHKIAEYLSSYPSTRDTNAVKKAKYIYSACTNTDYIQNNLIARIKDFMIHKAGGWENAGLSSTSSWSINTLYKDHYLGSTAFFQFGIEPDDLNSSLPMIRVSNKIVI